MSPAERAALLRQAADALEAEQRLAAVTAERHAAWVATELRARANSIEAAADE